MIDYGALPPEINSARMYAGAGSGPMLAAAGAWDVLAQELSLTAAAVDMTIADLTSGPWRGPSATAMAAAALPFTTWFKTTAAQAELAATQAKAAAAAFEAAYAMTVPPPVVLANRMQLLALIATNFFGQNTPAIAATEAHYASMWAQDAAAMYGYAGGSAAASQLSEFTSPPQTTNPAAPAGQATATSQAVGNSAASQALTTTTQALAQAGTATGTPVAPGAGTTVPPTTAALQELVKQLTTFTGFANSAMGPQRIIDSIAQELNGFEVSGQAVAESKDFLATLAPVAEAAKVGTAAVKTPGFGAATPSAALSKGIKIGALSVPQSWPVAPASANPSAATLVSSRIATTAAAEAGMMPRAGMAGMAGLPGLPGASAAAGGGANGFRFVPRYGYRHRMMQRPPSAG
ncbi:PPE family protein [[Mycobacterium] nativiensis]|uniref:PPE domain-containing protein n=1 Tax=[Mycobacterium] nativiensis TaxID=2855503 RepID=A0ABU5XWS4_9MYCO|nr:PPE family protein [Mycolicibacter sp. MYC340]MEB3032217.1 PPE domain-containing protein [Mycolicibacter sp. MYC340]